MLPWSISRHQTASVHNVSLPSYLPWLYIYESIYSKRDQSRGEVYILYFSKVQLPIVLTIYILYNTTMCILARATIHYWPFNRRSVAFTTCEVDAPSRFSFFFLYFFLIFKWRKLFPNYQKLMLTFSRFLVLNILLSEKKKKRKLRKQKIIAY